MTRMWIIYTPASVTLSYGVRCCLLIWNSVNTIQEITCPPPPKKIEKRKMWRNWVHILLWFFDRNMWNRVWNLFFNSYFWYEGIGKKDAHFDCKSRTHSIWQNFVYVFPVLNIQEKKSPASLKQRNKSGVARSISKPAFQGLIQTWKSGCSMIITTLTFNL